ncbi:hypothetical protein Anapl_17964 [Anas platyrhynchos]|uniref:Uncharacterized protein n=1 Tax=Anas platyrhynchos TaxID=8839 RepID=R0KUU1_ANAPL|nr:hypothetical protein Anapl_17964 [Anas platyrhynchos]
MAVTVYAIQCMEVWMDVLQVQNPVYVVLCCMKQPEGAKTYPCPQAAAPEGGSAYRQLLFDHPDVTSTCVHSVKEEGEKYTTRFDSVQHNFSELVFAAIFLYLFVCQLTSNSDSIFTVEATLVYRMSDAIPNPQYPDEEEGCNNCPRGLQLKAHTLHLLEHSSFNREPVEDVKLTEKNLKASAFSEWQHKHNIWLPVSSPDSSKTKGFLFLIVRRSTEKMGMWKAISVCWRGLQPGTDVIAAAEKKLIAKQRESTSGWLTCSFPPNEWDSCCTPGTAQFPLSSALGCLGQGLNGAWTTTTKSEFHPLSTVHGPPPRRDSCSSDEQLPTNITKAVVKRKSCSMSPLFPNMMYFQKYGIKRRCKPRRLSGMPPDRSKPPPDKEGQQLLCVSWLGQKPSPQHSDECHAPKQAAGENLLITNLHNKKNGKRLISEQTDTLCPPFKVFWRCLCKQVCLVSLDTGEGPFQTEPSLHRCIADICENRKPFFMGFTDTFEPRLWSEQNNKSFSLKYDLEVNAETKARASSSFVRSSHLMTSKQLKNCNTGTGKSSKPIPSFRNDHVAASPPVQEKMGKCSLRMEECRERNVRRLYRNVMQHNLVLIQRSVELMERLVMGFGSCS